MHEVNGSFWLFSISIFRYLFTISNTIVFVGILTIFWFLLFSIEKIRLNMYCLFTRTHKTNLETLSSFELKGILMMLYYSKITKLMPAIVRYSTGTTKNEFILPSVGVNCKMNFLIYFMLFPGNMFFIVINYRVK